MNLWIKKFTGWTKPNGHDRGKSYMNLKIDQHKVFKVEEQREKKLGKKNEQSLRDLLHKIKQ